jgi:hypothetical protein
MHLLGLAIGKERGLPLRLASLALVLSLASCSSTSSTADLVETTSADRSKPDEYMNFAKPLTSAMAQMSDKDALKMSAELTALGHQRQTGSISEAEYWRRVKEMRALAAPGAQ